MYQPSNFLRRSAMLFPSRVALVSGGAEYTYECLNKLANQAAHALIGRGIGRGSRVAYLIGNNPASVVVYQAAQKVGAVAVPLNKRLMPDDIAAMLTQVQAKILFFDDDVQDKALAAVVISKFDGQLVVVGAEIPGIVSWNEFKTEGATEDVEVEVASNEEALILFSSGTSGRPKAVVRTAGMVSMLALVQAVENGTDSSSHEVIYTQAPLFHLGGFITMLKAVALGNTLVMESHFCASRVFSLIEAYEITQIYMIPPVLFRRLAASEERKGRVFTTVRQAQCAGGKPTNRDVEALFDLFPACRLRVSFGSTEAGAIATAFFTEEQYREKPERSLCAGKANATVEVKLVASDGQQVGVGEVGEALVRSPMVFKLYEDMEAETQAVLDDKGFYHTGDLMRQDEEGYYTFVDRSHDMVKTGGENVWPTAVEDVVCQFPGVRECAVVGIPDELYGEGVAAAIVLENGVKDIDAETFIGFCRQRMPGYCRPRYLAILDELPRNSIGKLQKRVLRENPEMFVAL